MHVARVHLKCFRCFRGMFRLFRTDVAKVDRDVAYVAIISEACCKRMFRVFQMNVSSVCFRTHVASVFIWILHTFHIYVASVLCGC